MARRTKAEAQATRELLIDTAEHLFQQRGVSRTSLGDIAQAAGVTRGAIYWHFEDKADLFHAMMRRVTLPMEQAAERNSDPDLADPLAEVRRTVLEALTRTVSDPRVMRVFEIATQKIEYTDELSSVRTRHLASRNGYVAHLERGLRRAKRLGRLPTALSTRHVAIGLHALVDGLIRNWILEPSAFDLVKAGTQLLDAYLTGVGAVLD